MTSPKGYPDHCPFCGEGYAGRGDADPAWEAVEELKRLREALKGLYLAFNRMPDAGLTDDDPRRSWWFETFGEREAARAALDGPSTTESDTEIDKAVARLVELLDKPVEIRLDPQDLTSGRTSYELRVDGKHYDVFDVPFCPSTTEGQEDG